MDNGRNNSSINDEASKFTTKDDIAARMRDEANVEMAKQVFEWSKDNLARYDVDGNKRVNFAELDLGKRGADNNNDASALDYLEQHYNEIQKHSQNRFLFFKGKGGLSTDGIGEYLQDLEEQRAENEKTLAATVHERALQAGSRDIVGKMMSSDGNPNNSLFRVIDSLDGDIDHEITKKDLNRYLDEYQKRARYGDIDSGFFTPETRRYVEHLRDTWDSPEMIRLRGTYTTREHDGEQREVPNRTISEESLAKAIGVAKDGNVFAPFSKAPSQAAVVEITPLPAPPAIEVKPLPPVEALKDKAPAVIADRPVAKPAGQEKQTATVKHEPTAAKHTPTKHEPTVAKLSPALASHEPAAARPEPAKSLANVSEHPKLHKNQAEAAAPAVAAKPPAEAAVVEQAPIEGPAIAPARSPWKEPSDVTAYVTSRIQESYFKAEQYFTQVNSQAKAKDNEAVEKARGLNEWGKDNLRRFDTSGDNRLNYGEIDLGIRTSRGNDQSALSDIQNDYEQIKVQNTGIFGDRPDAVSQKDLQVNFQKKQEQALNNEQARMESAERRRQLEERTELASGLLASPDGNPNHTLFRVIDGLDNDIDNEISKRDLRRYMEAYENRSRYGDVGHGYFSQPEREYVEYLNNNWDSPQVKGLRGTYTDNDKRTQTYNSISLERLKQQLGMSRDEDVFQRFAAEQK